MKPFIRPAGRFVPGPSVRPILNLRWWAGTGALVGALLALLLFAPARWLAGAVLRATGQQVVLAESRGTVWHGSARLMLTGGAGSTDIAVLPERVQWTLYPGFEGLRFKLLAECCTPLALELRAAPRLRGLRVDLADAQARLPAALLAGLGTPWNTLQPSGQLMMQTRGLSVEWEAGRVMLTGSAVVEARDVGSRLSTLKPMGSYRLSLQGGPETRLAIETLEGSLLLTGNGQWNGSRLQFSGEASAAPGREAALENFLNIIGKRNGPRSIITLG